MQERVIFKVVDALASQQRIILWLDCNHKVTITERQVHEALRGGTPKAGTDRAICPYCPDLPPEAVRANKSAIQLWKDAGEP